MIGAGQPRRPGADDGDPVRPRRRAGDLNPARVDPVGGQAFEVADGDRLVHLGAPAGILAAVGANPAQNAGKRQVLHDDLQGLMELALLDHLDVALDVQPRRAGHAARGLVGLADGVGAGDGLGILLECGPLHGQAFVVIVRKPHGADLGAFPAAGALGGVDVTGFLKNFCREVPGSALQRQNLTLGDDLDVQMPADLDQFGRDNSHGAVVGGEGLVQLGHQPTDGG